MLGICLGCAIYSPQYNQYLKSQNEALVNNYGSARNPTVPNGPTMASPPELGTGTSNTQSSYYAYQPYFSSTQIIEACYDIQLTKRANLKPFVEYIINPAENSTVANSVVMGVSSKWFF